MTFKKDEMWEGLYPLTVEEIKSIDISSLNNMNSSLEGLEPITINLNDISGNLNYPHSSVGSLTSVYTLGGGGGISPLPSTIPTNVWSNTSSATWSMPTPTLTTSNGITTMSQDVEIKGNLKVGGKDIGSLLEKIEERLAIYHPEPELEEKWGELRELAKRYKELAADIKEKEKIWEILKK